VWSIQCNAAPTVEPVSIDDVKAWTRIDTSADDPLIKKLIVRERSYLEQALSRTFVTSTWTMRIDSFRMNYAGSWFDVFRVPNPPQVLGASPFGNVIYPYMLLEIANPPLQSVTSVQYYDTTGTLQTLVQGNQTGTGDYIVDIYGEQGRITPQYGTVWPWPRAVMNSVQVQYVAGYAYDATTPPPPPRWWEIVRELLLVHVDHAYNHRDGSRPQGVEALFFAADYGRAA
jgi:hypothetical protein